jgi:ubiquinone/menaquinone biosynthesis C-methylase UbiE
VVRRKIASPIYYVDISEKMIRLARERLREKAPEFEQSVHFICGSVSDIPEGIQFDLIITPYVLDCFAEKELPGVLKILTDTLNEKGIWLFVEFNVPGKGPQRAFAKTVIFLLYVFFALCCGLKQKGLANFHSFFQKLPLEATGQKTFCHGLLIACIYRRR